MLRPAARFHIRQRCGWLAVTEWGDVKRHDAGRIRHALRDEVPTWRVEHYGDLRDVPRA